MNDKNIIISKDTLTSYQTLRRFLQYFLPYRPDILMTMGLVIASAVCQATGPFLVGWSIDNLIMRGNWRGLMQILILLAIVYVTGSLIGEQCDFVG